MVNHLNQLREVQFKLSGYQDGLDSMALNLDSPFILLLVDELKKAAETIDFAVTHLEPVARQQEITQKIYGHMPKMDTNELATDGL